MNTLDKLFGDDGGGKKAKDKQTLEKQSQGSSKLFDDDYVDDLDVQQ